MAINTIVLTWQDNSDNETGYKVYQSTDGINFGSPTIVPAGSGTITYEAPGITSNQQYWFRVTTYNDAGESAYIESGPLACGLTKYNFGYWPKSYWPNYWYQKYWQLFGILGTKFIAKMRRISLHRRNL